MTRNLWVMFTLTGIFFGGICTYYLFTSLKVWATPISSNANTGSRITTLGILRAINGVDVTTECAGLVKTIRFKPGSDVKAGSVILELNADAEIAKLESLEAVAELAKMTYTRNKEQLAIQGISQATLDESLAELKSKNADVAEQKAIVERKVIRAPFEGRLGISHVNLGQYLEAGAKIISLQSLDPIYIDFEIPQEMLPQIKLQHPIYFTTNAGPSIVFEGKITCINSVVDSTTQKVKVEATLSNPKHKLLPGISGLIEIRPAPSH